MMPASQELCSKLIGGKRPTREQRKIAKVKAPLRGWVVYPDTWMRTGAHRRIFTVADIPSDTSMPAHTRTEAQMRSREH